MTDNHRTTEPLIGSKAWLDTIHDDAGDWHGDDDDRDWDEEDGDYEDCGLMHDGQCLKAGSEECDWECPNRSSELFVGSAAWRRKLESKMSSDQTKTTISCATQGHLWGPLGRCVVRPSAGDLLLTAPDR